MDFDGKVLLEESHPVDVTPLASKVYLDWPLKKLTDAGAADTSRVFVVADLTAGGASVSRNLIYLAPIKEIHLKPADLKVETAARTGATRFASLPRCWRAASIFPSAISTCRSPTTTSICCRARR